MAVTMKNTVFWDVILCSLGETNVSEECTASIFMVNRGGQVGRASFTLKMEAISSSKTPLSFYQTTRHHTPEDNTLYPRFYFKCVNSIETWSKQSLCRA